MSRWNPLAWLLAALIGITGAVHRRRHPKSGDRDGDFET